MKTFVAICCAMFLYPDSATGQRVVPFIAWSCADVNKPVADHSASNIYLSENGTTLVVKSHGGRTKMPVSGIWGYRGRNKALHRLVDGVDYTVCEADTLTVYMRRVHAGRIRKKQYYFSAGLCNPLYPLTVENIGRVYQAANPRFVSEVRDHWKWHRYLSSYNRGTQSYRIVTVYKKTIS
jgi:hypothetical protein